MRLRDRPSRRAAFFDLCLRCFREQKIQPGDPSLVTKPVGMTVEEAFSDVATPSLGFVSQQGRDEVGVRLPAQANFHRR